MSKSVASQVARLEKMAVDELTVEWERVFGRPTRQRHRIYLWRRLARKLQEDQLSKLTAEEEGKVDEYRDLIQQ